MTERDKQIIDLYLNNPELSVKDIANKFNISNGTVSRIARINNLPRRTSNSGTKLSNVDIENIIEEYKNGKAMIALQKKYNISYDRIKNILSSNNIEKISAAKHNNKDLIENYFEVIDSKDKAYWLGFLITDGAITYQPEKSKFQLELTLLPEDGHILHLLEKDLCVYNKVYDSGKQYKRFSLGSKKIVEDLVKLNITQKKSFTVKIPKDMIPNEFYPDLIRGIFDGDGGFTSYTRSNGQFCRELSFCGNEYVVTWVRDTLIKSIPQLTYKNVTNEKTIKRIRWGVVKDIQLIYNYMYYDKNDPHYLIRKKENIKANTELTN